MTLSSFQALLFWQGDITTLKLINDAINVVYRFEKNGEGYYLRITHPKIRSLHELNAALAYQNHLFLHGAQVCHPIKSINGNYIETIKQGDLLFYAHVYYYQLNSWC